MITAKTVKIWKIILVIFLIVNLIFIWGNSLPDQAASKKTSTEVAEIIKPVLEPVVGSGNVTDHLVRKLAHFVEFCALGVILALLLALRGKVSFQPILNSLYFGLFVALADETIQLFTDRGSQVQDVWLDFFGITAGFSAVLFIHLLIASFKKRGAKA